MAITINSIGIPQNVQVLLQSGGNLEPNTTYYCVVYAINEIRTTSALHTGLLISKLSAEVNFTTTDVNKSCLISWDAVTDAASYMVLMNRDGDQNYSDSGYLDGCGLRGYNDYTTTLTNSFLISQDTTYGGAYFITRRSSACHPCQNPTNGYGNWHGYYLGGMWGHDLSLVEVYISGFHNVCLNDIVDAMSVAGFADHVVWDQRGLFAIWAYIVIDSGATGGLRTHYEQNVSIANNLQSVMFWIAGHIQNNSENFLVQFGSVTAWEGGAITTQCVYAPQSYDAYFTNIKGYQCEINPSIGSMPSLLSYGTQLSDLDDMVACVFKHCRYTNFRVDMNHNRFHGVSTYRWWGAAFVEDIIFDIPTSVSIYPPNSTITPRDCQVICHVNSPNTFMQISGYNGNDYSNRIINVYDTPIKADESTINSWLDFWFLWSQAGGILPPFRVHFSFTLRIEDKEGNGIDGAGVTLYDKEGNILFTDQSVDGDVPKQDVRFYQFECNGTDGSGPDHTITTIYSPFTLIVEKQGFQSYIEADITGEAKVIKTISLQPPIYVDITPEVELEDEPTTISIIEVETE